MKENPGKLGFVKMKNFSAKGTIKRIRRHTTDWGKKSLQNTYQIKD